MSKLAVHLIRNTVDVTANKTLTVADQGIVQNVITDGVVMTLPSTVSGLTFTIRNGGAKVTLNAPAGATHDGSVGVTVSPAAADGVTGLGYTATVNKGAINTKVTSKVGDEITVVGSGAAGVGAWNVREAFGIWNRVA